MNRGQHFFEAPLIGPLLISIRGVTLFLLSMVHYCFHFHLEQRDTKTLTMNRVSSTCRSSSKLDSKMDPFAFCREDSKIIMHTERKFMLSDFTISALSPSSSFQEERCPSLVDGWKTKFGADDSKREGCPSSPCWKHLKDVDLLLGSNEGKCLDMDKESQDTTTEASSGSETLTIESIEDDDGNESFSSDRHSVYELFDDVSVLTSDSSMDYLMDEEDSHDDLAVIEDMKIAFELDDHMARDKEASCKAVQDDKLMSFLLDLCEPAST